MKEHILGLHHITAISDDAQRNYDFYTKVMGLRMVKKTVNFDDPGTYHFYFGNETGTPGAILTFFPWEGIGKGHNGTGMATEIGYSVPEGSLVFWTDRFNEHKISFAEQTERFGEILLPFTDPDGLNLSLIIPKGLDDRKPWETAEIKAAQATKGFHSVTLTIRHLDDTARILTDVFGYRQIAQEGKRYRFVTDAVPTASIVDIVLEENGHPGRNAAGTNHHVAFRVKDEATQMAFHEKLLSMGLRITSKINRDYFFSLYFREPGGVLFEIATDNPGFTVDEPLAELGSHLKLPKQHEGLRGEIEKKLPIIKK
ncbi:MAG: ring-cleaving dioxygenase [Sporocytophaga sp.]|uniref:ring-cleaving dioxygenase n=1 Tax=Sporocytophaga sp. TaxID=2231183 RepID=UPI001B268A47|nr:ring-cleaving dioxygenase [Sporocytophaga sp.]MBO9701879.1 ring-cleaving dioxygenase [Sporocytophaga sp.]